MGFFHGFYQRVPLCVTLRLHSGGHGGARLLSITPFLGSFRAVPQPVSSSFIIWNSIGKKNHNSAWFIALNIIDLKLFFIFAIHKSQITSNFFYRSRQFLLFYFVVSLLLLQMLCETSFGWDFFKYSSGLL